MAIEIIPNPVNDANYQMRIALDGRDFIMRFTYNQRAAKWYLTVYDAEGSPIVAGVRLTAGRDVFYGVSDLRAPPGKLYVVDMRADDDTEPRDPAYGELGSRVVLSYLDEEEIADVEAG